MGTRPDDLAPGQRLKRHRDALGLTQAELARRAGCTVSMLQKIERGERRPSPAMLERLMDLLGVRVDERAGLLGAFSPSAGVPPHAAGPYALTPLSDQQAQRHAASEPERASDTPPREYQLLDAASPLLLTKILPPPAGSNIVLRSRLLSRLQTMRHGGLTLLVAPAGWGKTTLLTSWVAGLPGVRQHIAWLALDERDSDVLLMLRYMIAALQRSHPVLGHAALQLLNSPQPLVESVLTLLINDMILIETPLVLVLDDYHRVRAPAIHDALVYLIDHLPPNLHIVIASRENPPFPLPRLRVRHHLNEIRAAELRFTSDEAARFFADVMDLAVSDDVVTVLEQRTEGWITGLLLAALTMRERADQEAFIQAFTGSHRLVLDYLSEEVLAHLPPHLYDFMLQTSILRHLCGPLCDAVLGIEMEVPTPGIGTDSYSRLLLEQLERASLFLTPLDDQRIWYRYHQLFATVLRERLQRGTSTEMVAVLHTRAARWFEARGLVTDAIDHALAAAQFENAAGLIEQVGGALLQSGATTQLQAMIEALPAEMRRKRPRLVSLLGLCALQESNIDAARTWFEQAAALFGAADDALGRGDSLIHLADCYRTLGAVLQAHDALTEALAGPLPPARRAVALRGQVYEALAAGRWQQADASLDQAVVLIEQSGDQEALTELAMNLRSIVLVLPGGVERAAHVRRVINRQMVAPLSMLRAADSFLAGIIHLQRGDVRTAYDDFIRASGLTDQLAPLSLLSLDTAACLLRCAALVDDLSNASHYADRLVAMLDHPTLAGYRSVWGAAYLFGVGWLRWLERDYDAARRIVDEVDALANEYEWPVAGLARRLLRSLMVLVEARWEAAESMLGDLLVDQEQFRDSLSFGDAGALLAYTQLQTGNHACAADVLDTVLARHEQQRTPGLLLLLGQPVVEALLRFAVANQIRADFAGQTLRLLHHASRTQPGTQAASVGPRTARDLDALSEREREVLHLIAAGASNSEIAARLIVSLATVKKHINHIFAKLQVDSRTQALVRARERGIL